MPRRKRRAAVFSHQISKLLSCPIFQNRNGFIFQCKIPRNWPCILMALIHGIAFNACVLLIFSLSFQYNKSPNPKNHL
jgi:hypothetical protein